MCIFSGSVKEVSKTKILVSQVFPAKIIDARDKTGRSRRFKKPIGKPLQLTVYQNSVQLSRNPMDASGRPNTAMILPFPLRSDRKNRVQLLNMENYEGLFDDLESVFSQRVVLSKAYTLSDNQSLDVYNIGSYQASIVPNFDSLDKVDTIFNVVPDVKQLLKQYYGRGFGFVICILKNSAKFHPFAYVHELRMDGKFFVPTRHFHGAGNVGLMNSEFARFHEPGLSMLPGILPGSAPEDDYPLEADINMSGQNDPGRGHTRRATSGMSQNDEVQDYYHDVLMMEDKWINHHAKRRDTDVNEKAVVDWDHEIYIINHPTTLKSSLLKRPGITAEFPDKHKITRLSEYIMMNNFPREISFGGIRSLFRIHIEQLYQGYHDLFI